MRMSRSINNVSKSMKSGWKMNKMMKKTKRSKKKSKIQKNI